MEKSTIEKKWEVGSRGERGLENKTYCLASQFSSGGAFRNYSDLEKTFKAILLVWYENHCHRLH